MDKISVIIPTIQKNLRVLEKLLSVLNSDKAVSEIIVINNSQNSLNLNFSKLKIHNSPTNLYVNASWNLGISMIKNNFFLIINDDIICVKDYCTKVLATGILDKKTTGLVGIDPDFIKQNPRETLDIEIPNEANVNIQPKSMNNYMNTRDWGSAFFGKKQNYYPIPDGIKIIFGDNYLLKKNLDEGKINYKISGCPFNHIHSLSSAAPEFYNILQNDVQNSRNYVQ